MSEAPVGIIRHNQSCDSWEILKVESACVVHTETNLQVKGKLLLGKMVHQMAVLLLGSSHTLVLVDNKATHWY